MEEVVVAKWPRMEVGGSHFPYNRALSGWRSPCCSGYWHYSHDGRQEDGVLALD